MPRCAVPTLTCKIWRAPSPSQRLASRRYLVSSRAGCRVGVPPDQFSGIGRPADFDANGDRLYTTGSDTTPRTHISDRSYFRLLATTAGRPGVFELLISVRGTSQAWLPPRHCGTSRVLFAALRWPRSIHYFQSCSVAGSWRPCVVSIYRSDNFTRSCAASGRRQDRYTLPPGNPIRAALAPGIKTATIEFPSSTDGFVRTYSSRVLDRYPFFVTAGLGAEDVLAGWRGARWRLVCQPVAVGAAGRLLYCVRAEAGSKRTKS